MIPTKVHRIFKLIFFIYNLYPCETKLSKFINYLIFLLTIFNVYSNALLCVYQIQSGNEAVYDIFFGGIPHFFGCFSSVYLFMKNKRFNCLMKEITNDSLSTNNYPILAYIMPLIYITNVFCSFILYIKVDYDKNKINDLDIILPELGYNFAMFQWVIREIFQKIFFFKSFYSICLYYYYADTIINCMKIKVMKAFDFENIGRFSIISNNINDAIRYVEILNDEIWVLLADFIVYLFIELQYHANCVWHGKLVSGRSIHFLLTAIVKYLWFVYFMKKINEKFDSFKTYYNQMKTSYLEESTRRTKKCCSILLVEEKLFELLDLKMPESLKVKTFADINHSTVVNFTTQFFTFYFMIFNFPSIKNSFFHIKNVV